MADYAGMSLHEELETRFADAERRRQEEEFLSRGWQPPAGWQRVGQGLRHDLEDIGYGIKKPCPVRRWGRAIGLCASSE